MKLSAKQIVYLRRCARARLAMQDSETKKAKLISLTSLSEMIRRYVR